MLQNAFNGTDYQPQLNDLVSRNVFENDRNATVLINIAEETRRRKGTFEFLNYDEKLFTKLLQITVDNEVVP